MFLLVKVGLLQAPLCFGLLGRGFAALRSPCGGYTLRIPSANPMVFNSNTLFSS